MNDLLSSPLHVVHVHVTPNVNAGSEVSLRVSLDGLRDSSVRSSLVCAEQVAAQSLPGLEAVVTAPEVFAEQPASPLGVRSLARRFESIITQLRPDVVHVHLGVRAEIVERIAARWPVVYSAHVPVCPNGARYLHRDQLVCTAPVSIRCMTAGFRTHGCGHLADGTPVSLPAFSRGVLNARRLLRALRACETVIAPSRWQAARLAADGVPSERIAVVHPPVVPCERTPTIGPPVVAFAGRLLPFKGAEHMLRACADIPTAHRLWIIGDGPQRSELEELARRLGLSNRALFHGAVPPQEARRLLGCAHVVVVPSLCAETFNLVGAQAAAGGIPVVAFDVGGMRDWAERYINVELVAPRDGAALGRAIDFALARSTYDYATDCVLPFSVRRHVAALLEIYSAGRNGLPLLDPYVPINGLPL
jgi:glycosyltransferase involved in cell wall biosynthesis